MQTLDKNKEIGGGFQPWTKVANVFCCFGEAQLLKKSAWLLHVIEDEAPATACNESEVSRTSNRTFYHHASNPDLWDYQSKNSPWILTGPHNSPAPLAGNKGEKGAPS